jgi:hypothetical protein
MKELLASFIEMLFTQIPTRKAAIEKFMEDTLNEIPTTLR